MNWIIFEIENTKDRNPYDDRYRPDDRYNGMGGGNRYRPDDRDRYGGGGGGGGGGMYPPSRRYPPRYPPSRYPMDNSIGGGDMGGRYYPENRYPDARPDRYPESDGRYYPMTVTGTRYPTSDNRFPVGNDRSPIFILKYGNRFGSGGGSGKSDFSH